MEWIPDQPTAAVLPHAIDPISLSDSSTNPPSLNEERSDSIPHNDGNRGRTFSPQATLIRYLCWRCDSKSRKVTAGGGGRVEVAAVAAVGAAAAGVGAAAAAAAAAENDGVQHWRKEKELPKQRKREGWEAEKTWRLPKLESTKVPVPVLVLVAGNRFQTAAVEMVEGREQKVADCGPVEPHWPRCPHPATWPAAAVEKVRPNCSTGDGSGGGRWAGTDGADAGADEGGAGEGEGEVDTTLVGAAVETPVGGCWCSRRGSALGSGCARAPGVLGGPTRCTAARGAPVRRRRRLPPPQSTSTAVEAINSPGSKLEPNSIAIRLIILFFFFFNYLLFKLI